nr:hypothetical protein [Tanacetum cinerariifolium]
MPELEDITYSDDEKDVGTEVDFTNLETTITVSPILTTRVHKDHPVTQIIGDLSLATQTRSMTRVAKDQGRLSQINNDDFHTCMFACFLLQEEPKRVYQALKDPSWIEALHEELLQFKIQKVWVLVDLPNGKRTIGHTQEEGTDYKEVFAPVARIEAIRLFLAYASFMGFMVYQMDVKSAFLYGTIEEEVYVCQPLGFEDPDYPGKIYVDDIIFGSTNKDLCKAFEKLMKDNFQMSSMGELTFFLGLQVKQKQDGIFISQDKYIDVILRKFSFTDGKSASTPMDTEKPLLKDLDVKRIFRCLKGKPHLGLWYPKDSPFNLVDYSDSDYAGASLDRKSTTGGCQFLGCRLISWKCKKQTVVATSSTKADGTNSLAGVTEQLSSGNSFALTVAKYSSSGIPITSSGNEEPKKIIDALKDPSWVEAIKEELLQFKIQNVWILVDCPKGIRPIGTKWVLKNKKDERGIMIRNKARLVAQWHTQEEGVDYEEVFAPFARIEAIRLFLAYASFMGFTVYQMEVKSVFLYCTIHEEVYVMQPLGFQDPEFPDRVYKVEKAMYELHQAPRAWYGTLSKYLLDNEFPDRVYKVEKAMYELHQAPRAWVYNFSKMVFDGMVRNVNSKGSKFLMYPSNGLAIPTEPHHTPSSQEQHSSHHDTSSPSHPTTTTEPIPQTSTETLTITPTLRQYSRRATRIAQSKALSPAADEHASLLRDDSQGEAFPTVSSLDAGQDMENINKTSVLPYESSPRVTSLDADEGSMQQKLQELMDLCAGLQRQQTQMADKIKDQDLEISSLKARRLSEQLARDSEIARLHAEKELKMMIEGLDRSNEMIAKHLQKYEQAATDLSIGEKIELINELEQREFYMSVLRSHAGWKTRHFRGMTLKEIKEKFIPVWKQVEDFVPMSLKEEDLKGLMQLVLLEEVYVEAMQFDREDLYQLWILVKETLTIKQAIKDKEKELWVELKRLFEPDFKDQLWTHN